MKVILEMIKERERAFIIIKVVVDMKEIIEMVKKMEKVYFIGMAGIDMKVTGKMIIWKEKELSILIMVIEEWGIILMINQ